MDMDSRSNGSNSNNFKGNNARDHARQHNGNVFNNYENYYNLRQRRSDETLREDGRNQALLNAASEGQTPRVKHLLQLGAEIDYTDEHGLTALHHAALSGFHDTVSTVLEAGADVNAESVDCGTALHLAALKGRSHVVRLLLASRADVSRRSRMIGTAFHCACFAGDLVAMDELHNHGANIAAVDIVRLNLIYSIYTAGVFYATDLPYPSASGSLFDILQCQPWHMAFLGNNDSALVFAPMRLPALQVAPKAWYVNFLQDGSSNITSVHCVGQLDILRYLVHMDCSKVLHTLLVESTSAPVRYLPIEGHEALGLGLALERVDCVRLLLRFRANVGIDEDHLNRFQTYHLPENKEMREMLLDPSSTEPVWPKLRRVYLSTRVLKYYDMPWEYSGDKSEYILIRREMTQSEIDVLCDATTKVRSGEWNPQQSGGPFSGKR